MIGIISACAALALVFLMILIVIHKGDRKDDAVVTIYIGRNKDERT